MMANEKSLSCLLDVNIWFPFIQVSHPHHSFVREWHKQQPDQSLVFCRTTQLAVLRLMTEKTLMGGIPYTQRGAWAVMDSLLADPKATFRDEPSELTAAFRRASDRDETSPKRWTDDYLAAFAEAANLTLVTFDKALAARTPKSTLLTP